MGQYISADRHPGVSETRVSGQSLTQFMRTWGCVGFCVSARRNSRAANNSSIIHTRVHPRNTRPDVGLNIGLDLWLQLTMLMLIDLLHVETILTDLTNHEILPFVSNLE